MNFQTCTHAMKFMVEFKLRSCLLIRSGEIGEFSDSTIARTPDGKKLEINGYVWSSLLRRCLERLKNDNGLANKIGKYDSEINSVSNLWLKPSFVDLPFTDNRSGNKIDRKKGSASEGALYNDEIVPPGLSIPLQCLFFCDASEIKQVQDAFSAALWVVNENIENIGGGWSYGFGRLECIHAYWKKITLSDEHDRKRLFRDEESSAFQELEIHKPDIKKPWVQYTVQAQIQEGQLLAIHNDFPSVIDAHGGKLPDKFLFRRMVVGSDSSLSYELVIPGKSLRQALFSVPIERKLRSKNEDCCDNPSELCTCNRCKDHWNVVHKKENSPDCQCRRCQWFGNTEKGGMVAVFDAPLSKTDTVILNRIQLCEHSAQNVQLFSSEYLKAGDFSFEVVIDRSCDGPSAALLMKEIEIILSEMNPGGDAPPGWHRIGVTSTATGQLSLLECQKLEYGEVHCEGK